MRIRRFRRAYLFAEYCTAFYGLAAAYALFLRGTSPLPFLAVLGAIVAAYLWRSPTFDRRSLWRPRAMRAELPSMGLLWATTAVGLSIAIAVIRPDLLFALPREQPLIWLLVLIFYPVLSVYPQELIYRAFVFDRYTEVFGTGHMMVAASAVSFGFAHIAFGSWISVAMTIAGGWIFAMRYRRTESLFTASAEHALYGILIFTVGLGEYFYHGAAAAQA